MKQCPFLYSKLYLIIAQDHNITWLERPVAKMLTTLFAKFMVIILTPIYNIFWLLLNERSVTIHPEGNALTSNWSANSIVMVQSEFCVQSTTKKFHSQPL